MMVISAGRWLVGPHRRASFAVMANTIEIGERFRGPPTSGNGGYTCGLVAALMDSPAEVTLRAPPPLDTPMTVVRGDRVEVHDGDTLVATAEPASYELDLPGPVSLAEATRAAEGFRGFQTHAFDTCFVCGPGREPGDGMRLFTGPVDRRDVVACVWRPLARDADPSGTVAPEIMWAVLDCPSCWAVNPDGDAIVLGRMYAELWRSARVGDGYVVVGWPVGRDGRKRHSGAVVFSADGEPLCASRATWIELATRGS